MSTIYNECEKELPESVQAEIKKFISGFSDDVVKRFCILEEKKVFIETLGHNPDVDKIIFDFVKKKIATFGKSKGYID